MYLKELEIYGFKSFPEKTSLKFEPGITVIVGPNGCGKSNTLDAIKWALGEQSPKSLRGTKMEDIIFNGTEHYAPLNYAEVIMTFANEDNYLPIDFKEVSIGRRLYRSGDSEYYLNKNIVRLRDIEDLFMGTGVGESTYSFIEQGKIDLFLSYKPEDKRLIFDEASGIVKYKDRRKETMRRLEETDENMVRLDDIISEVKRQIRYLERQVEKARQYKEVQERLLMCEQKIAAVQMREIDDTVTIFKTELVQLGSQETAKEQELHDIRGSQEALNGQLQQLRRQLEEAGSSVIALNADVGNCESHINVYRQRIKELELHLLQLEENRRTLGERLRTQDTRIAAEHAQFSVIDQEVCKTGEDVVALQAERAALAAQIAGYARSIESDKLVIFDLENKKSHSNNLIIELQANLVSFAKRKQRLFLDAARLEGLVAESKTALDSVGDVLAGLDTQLAISRQKCMGLEAKEKLLASRREELRTKLIEKEKELVELKSYHEFLRDLRTKYDSFAVTKKVTVFFDEEPSEINKIVATIRGAEIIQDGSRYYASVEAKVVSHDEVQLQERMDALTAEIQQLAHAIAEAQEQLQVLGQEMNQESELVEDQERKWQEKTLEKENLEREYKRLGEEAQLTRQEIDSTLESIAAFESNQAAAQKEMLGIDAGLEQARLSLHTAQESTERHNARIQDIEVEEARKEAHKQSLDKERQNLGLRINLLENEKATIASSLESVERETAEDSAKIETLGIEIENLRKRIETNTVKIEEASARKQAFESQEQQAAAAMEQQRRTQQAAEKELESVRGLIYDKKLHVQSREYEKEKIKDYIRQVYQVEFDASVAGENSEPFDALTEERAKLQKRKQSLGEVNLVAIEEYQELKKREDFLVQQKDDLVTSKENLKKAIAKINKTCRDLFIDTFEKIQEEFKKNFRFLFNGGRAQLLLVDPDNVLESGVEIEVQPPGKKLQNVSLLSGGEKALTAISLIFAIFRVRPSPLCVLDEIDAPLDEANVDRFNHILRDFSSCSQFVLITHNKKTMANSDILYGVTMQEKGVSKLVSVKFGHHQKPADALSESAEPAVRGVSSDAREAPSAEPVLSGAALGQRTLAQESAVAVADTAARQDVLLGEVSDTIPSDSDKPDISGT